MAEEKKGKRAYSYHADCDHEDTKWARKKCRQGRLVNGDEHANCEHGDAPADKMWCTRRRNEAAAKAETEGAAGTETTMSFGDLLNRMARNFAEANGYEGEIPDFNEVAP